VVEDTEVELNEIDGVTPVHARYYELSSSYYRTIGNHCEYYKNALRYLGCIKYEQLSTAERQERAFYLSLAAILGDDIFNFGELVI
jgi:26S proteasome regulatory subunit N9